MVPWQSGSRRSLENAGCVLSLPLLFTTAATLQNSLANIPLLISRHGRGADCAYVQSCREKWNTVQQQLYCVVLTTLELLQLGLKTRQLMRSASLPTPQVSHARLLTFFTWSPHFLNVYSPCKPVHIVLMILHTALPQISFALQGFLNISKNHDSTADHSSIASEHMTVVYPCSTGVLIHVYVSYN